MLQSSCKAGHKLAVLLGMEPQQLTTRPIWLRLASSGCTLNLSELHASVRLQSWSQACCTSLGWYRSSSQWGASGQHWQKPSLCLSYMVQSSCEAGRELAVLLGMVPQQLTVGRIRPAVAVHGHPSCSLLLLETRYVPGRYEHVALGVQV